MNSRAFFKYKNIGLPCTHSIFKDTVGYGIQKNIYVRELYQMFPDDDVVSLSSLNGFSGVYIRDPYLFRNLVLLDSSGNFEKSNDLLFRELRRFLGTSTIVHPRETTTQKKVFRETKHIVGRSSIPSPKSYSTFISIIEKNLSELDCQLNILSVKGTPFDLNNQLTQFTFGVICEIFFGLDPKRDIFTAQASNLKFSDVMKAKRRIIRFISKKMFRLGVSNPLKYPTFLKSLIDFNDLCHHIDQVGGGPFNHMLKERFPNDVEHRVSQIKGIVFAGLHTTAVSLLYLCKNCQEHLSHDQSFKSLLGSIDEDVHVSMYRETLRLNPTQPQIARTACRDILIDGTPHAIPAGTPVAYDVQFSNCDSKYWPSELQRVDLNQFDPTRFIGFFEHQLPDSNTFAGGVSSCSGKELAYLQGRLFIKHILSKYVFDLESNLSSHPWFVLLLLKEPTVKTRVSMLN